MTIDIIYFQDGALKTDHIESIGNNMNCIYCPNDIRGYIGEGVSGFEYSIVSGLLEEAACGWSSGLYIYVPQCRIMNVEC